ncbi:MAG: (Fe-S)-binding protein [Bacteroidales bacterium]|nr:(Fe-S)-binding protein [Bacteroidales bacterium]
MMQERVLEAFDPFVLPFLCGMVFVLLYCFWGLAKIFYQLDKEERAKVTTFLFTPTGIVKNLKDMFLDCLIHVKLWKRNVLLGFMHSSIAFGWFMLIVLGHIETWFYIPERMHLVYYPIFFRYFIQVNGATVGGALFFFLMDFFLLVVLIGIGLAIFKRFRSMALGMKRTTRLTLLDHIGLYSLWMIFPLRWIAEGFTAGVAGGSFMTVPINWLLSSFMHNPENITIAWWAYSIDLGIFMFCLPFTRYMHIPTEILLIPMRNAGLRVRAHNRGFARAQMFTCPSCGVCIDACPMGLHKRSKDATVYLVRQYKRNNAQRSLEIAQKCLMCGKCGALCPIQIDAVDLRLAYRSAQNYNISPDFSYLGVSGTLQMPATGDGAGLVGKETAGTVKTIVTTIGGSVKSIGGSVKSIGQKIMNLGSSSEQVSQNIGSQKVLYYAGCMSSLTPVVRTSVEKLLNAAGVDWSNMDRDRSICCGRPLFLSGRLQQAAQLVEANTKIIKESGARILLVSCAICYRMFKEKYELEGVRVMHYTEYFNELIKEKRLKIEHSDLKYVYHDPCDLGRGCGIYEEPREAVACAGKLVPAAKERSESICCGGSVGSLTLTYEERGHITEHSVANLMTNSPDSIITACPLCLTTYSKHAPVPVKDFAQLLAERLMTKQ